ncbi:MAG: hypothetical protein DI532_23185 [Azospirillum brasilense]|nr:MAG: hypothetical protein DI532_23185 [Azospirillum brasilense]
MARRRLLNDEQWAALFALPAGERDVVRHCTLTPDDHTLIAAKRSASNRLGYALLLCALRHPGRVLEPGERPPAPMVAFVARQLGIDPAVLATGPDRPQTRREQLAELMRLGRQAAIRRGRGGGRDAGHGPQIGERRCRCIGLMAPSGSSDHRGRKGRGAPDDPRAVDWLNKLD